MAKSRTSFLCRECGSVQTQWMGKCPDCGVWDALEKYVESKMAVASGGGADAIATAWLGDPDQSGLGGGQGAPGVPGAPVAIPLPDIEASEVDRWSTGVGELNRVLGGGLVRGSAVLVGGDPGIGKSTLLLQAAAGMSCDRTVLYVSSEESAYQTRLRAERLFGESINAGRSGSPDRQGQMLDRLLILADTNLGRIIEQARKTRPDVLIIDSIQMIHRSDVDAAPGSIAQLRRCCQELVYLAKLSGMAVILVGHVTKQGQLAGPKLIEHLVDTVLSFEGDRYHAHRVVRAIKNRYGTTLEVALFEMTGSGLVELEDRALQGMADSGGRPGSVLCPAMHGSRCLLVELQALTATGFLGNARRKASGLDSNRLAMLIAVLEKHGGLRLADQDVFVSSTGGLKIGEPAADLALALAIAGAHFGRSLPERTGVIGEVGLGGEVRRTSSMEQRLREAARLGCKRMICPVSFELPSGLRGLKLCHVPSVSQGIEQLDP